MSVTSEAAPRILPVGAADRRRILVAGDVAVLGAVTLVALRLGAVRSGWEWSSRLVAEQGLWLLILVLGWMGLAWAGGLYDRRRAPDPALSLVLSAKVSAQLLVIWALVYFLPPPWTLVRHVVVFFALGAAVVMPIWRLGYARVFSSDALRRRIIVVGAGVAGRHALEAARAAPHEFEVLGFVDDDPELRAAVVDGAPVLGDSVALVGIAQARGATDVILAITRNVNSAAFAALMDARERGLAVTPMTVFYEDVTGRVPVEHIGDQWAVSLPMDPPESRGLYRGLKRGLDVALAAVGAAVLGVLLIGLAPLMIVDAGRPVFYRQTRSGRGGESFTLLKLRTMRTDAEDDGPRWSEPLDARVTRMGKWLRRLGVDELPQCLNILAGDMSLVGPRPERPEFVRRLADVVPFYRARHAVRPGLTGWAAINQGYVNTEDAALVRLQYDLYYIKHQSLLLDLYVLLRTLSTVLRRR